MSWPRILSSGVGAHSSFEITLSAVTGGGAEEEEEVFSSKSDIVRTKYTLLDDPTPISLIVSSSSIDKHFLRGTKGGFEEEGREEVRSW